MVRTGVLTMLLMSLVACNGKDGRDGTDGAPGTNGTNGTNGMNGADGVDGATGPAGKDGVDGSVGPTGPSGAPGDAGADGCDGLNAGAHRSIAASVMVTAPANGQFFVEGERAQLHLSLTDDCGRALRPTQLGTANLYVTGPRAPARVKSASKLLNAVTNRSASDRQHHYINLRAPHYADPDAGAPNLTDAADGGLQYTLEPITTEAAGTYTAALWVKSTDELEQHFVLADFQLGTSVVEVEATGAGATSSCLACHQNASGGFVTMHHSVPGFSPRGDFALDSNPVATCRACHNLDGFSPNSTQRKVHAVHRGSHQQNPGAAHPADGTPEDPSLLNYTDVVFPSMPGAERTCAACHRTDSHFTQPSRATCGSCHDAISFDTGVLSPARSWPSNCAIDADCKAAGFGEFVTCDTGLQACVRKSHPVQTDDTHCSTCHAPQDGGVSPVDARHEVVATTRSAKFNFTSVQFTGGTGVAGSFRIGDVPSLLFKLQDGSGAPVSDLVTNSRWSGSMFLSGPSNLPQRVYGGANGVNLRTAGLSYDGASHTYTLPLPAWPVNAQLPLNAASTATPQPNAAGTYDLTFYAAFATTVSDDKNLLTTFRDVANFGPLGVSFGDASPVQTRQVVLNAACNTCHGTLQAHGGSRQNAQGCVACHSPGAQDKIEGSTGSACSLDTDCKGYASGWEHCVISSGTSGLCTVSTDPTPGLSIEVAGFMHSLHFARLRAGYLERNFSVPGRFQIYAGGSNLIDYGTSLISTDARSCTQCHASTQSTCNAATTCGYGQRCVGAVCQNVSWKKASTRACLSCHDSAADFGHVRLQTYDPGGGAAPIETCDVCHGEAATFSVEATHALANPYRPPYAREP